MTKFTYSHNFFSDSSIIIILWLIGGSLIMLTAFLVLVGKQYVKWFDHKSGYWHNPF